MSVFIGVQAREVCKEDRSQGVARWMSRARGIDRQAGEGVELGTGGSLGEALVNNAGGSGIPVDLFTCCHSGGKGRDNNLVVTSGRDSEEGGRKAESGNFAAPLLAFSALSVEAVESDRGWRVAVCPRLPIQSLAPSREGRKTHSIALQYFALPNPQGCAQCEKHIYHSILLYGYSGIEMQAEARTVAATSQRRRDKEPLQTMAAAYGNVSANGESHNVLLQLTRTAPQARCPANGPRKLAAGLPRSTALALDVKSQDLDRYVASRHVFVSLVPFIHHADIIRSGIRGKTHLVTSSYVTPAIREACEQAGITVFIIDSLMPSPSWATGALTPASTTSRQSSSSSRTVDGLPAPEAANNPVKFKFSWSLVAPFSPIKELIASAVSNHVLDGYSFLAYPNRGSTIFREFYKFQRLTPSFEAPCDTKGNRLWSEPLIDPGWIDSKDKSWLKDDSPKEPHLIEKIDELFHPGERDLVILPHNYVVKWKRRIRANMKRVPANVKGFRNHLWNCSQMILDGFAPFNQPGVLRPYTKEIFDPLRAKVKAEEAMRNVIFTDGVLMGELLPSLHNIDVYYRWPHIEESGLHRCATNVPTTSHAHTSQIQPYPFYPLLVFGAIHRICWRDELLVQSRLPRVPAILSPNHAS
ncbi:hypothetical protein SODALDRAFT_375926 [Sodiomyces alkalinus F11]|uniref:Uncharacterized protein n=1 Tax=Sodiomyces alkalinus (strain CBS 110278 / VKM F-3762 / F11) TaxID=1314773 RepID=A0A3N2QAZ2_SODAK|nr:hypothetical protein SODALDRAFT_375926 [Sodiomyces alkalinus F11]ROT43795.1 hypothetical protein SODALDRAFT_375926 [Sodiomyces alkalinus F11]